MKILNRKKKVKNKKYKKLFIKEYLSLKKLLQLHFLKNQKNQNKIKESIKYW